MKLDMVEVLAITPPFSAHYIKANLSATFIYFSLFAVTGFVARIFIRSIHMNLTVFSMVTAGPIMVLRPALFQMLRSALLEVRQEDLSHAESGCSIS